MGVLTDQTGVMPFKRPGAATDVAMLPQNSTRLRIRQQANTARQRGTTQLQTFDKLINSADATAKAAGLLVSHRKLIDDLISHVMFGE